jgi:thiol-disulfide isomerase/thioredoxin
MSKSKLTAAFAAAMVSLLALSAYGAGKKDDESGAMMQKDDGMKPAGEAMMAKDDMAEGFYDLAGLGPGVGYYSGEEATAKAAMMDGRKPVYFFAASWCPTCKATYEDNRKNAASIPADLRIVFVNFDTEKDLKMKYGVTYQHTFVVPDDMGKAPKVWSGTATVAEIAAKAKGM